MGRPAVLLEGEARENFMRALTERHSQLKEGSGAQLGLGTLLKRWSNAVTAHLWSVAMWRRI